jgi:hypothetical protein
MAKVVKRSDLSKKDFKVESSILRVKDSSYNIVSNIGDGSMANFNESNPLLYWAEPLNPKVNAIAHVLFNDGLAYYTFNGILWVLNFFYPSSSYERPYKVYTALISQDNDTNPPTSIVLENTLGGIPIWSRDGLGQYTLGLTGGFIGNGSNTQFTYFDSADTYKHLWLQKNGDDRYSLTTYTTDPLTTVEGYFSNLFIEIRVYP